MTKPAEEGEEDADGGDRWFEEAGRIVASNEDSGMDFDGGDEDDLLLLPGVKAEGGVGRGRGRKRRAEDAIAGGTWLDRLCRVRRRTASSKLLLG